MTQKSDSNQVERTKKSQGSVGQDKGDTENDQASCYQREWLASGASPETIDLNVFWLDRHDATEDQPFPAIATLLYSPNIKLLNNNRVPAGLCRQYQYLENGYWGVDGLDPLNNWQAMDWFQAKPITPSKWYEVKDDKGFKSSERARPEYVDKYTWNKVAKHFGLSTMAEPHMLHPAGFWDWAEKNDIADKFYLKEHVQKYVSPPKTPTRATFLRISNNQSTRHFGEELPSEADGAAEATGHWSRWLGENKPIAVIEDAGKKSGCIINNVTGVMPIGLPGICGGVRSEKDDHGRLVPGGEKWLIEELKVFATKNRLVYLCFDQDKKQSTRHATFRELRKLGKQYEAAGCRVKVVTWPKAWGKGIDDVWANGHDIQTLFDRAQTFNQFLNGYLWKLTREPDLEIGESDLIEVNGKRYLDLKRPDPRQHPLVFIKAPKGLGKTEQVRKWADDAKRNMMLVGPDMMKVESGMMMLVHRRTLGRSLADRLGTDFVDENYKGFGRPNPSEDDDGDGSNGIALCWDSLRENSRANLKPKDFAGKIIFLDEVEQSIKHLLQSSTCKKDRPQILRFWAEALKICITTGGQVICSDADLSDVTLAFFRDALSKQEISLDPYVIVCDYCPPSYKTFTFEGRDPSELLVHIERQLGQGKKVVLFADSQKPESKWGTYNLLKKFSRKFPDKKMGRVDSETVSAVSEDGDGKERTPLYPQFGIGECINQHLQMFQYDLLIVSPTIGSGVSIDIRGLFDFVGGIAFGVVPSSEFRQALMRYRELVPRLIWVNSRGLGIQGGSKLPKAIKQNRSDMLRWANRRLELGLTDEEIEPHGVLAIFEQTEAKLQARVVADCQYYRENVISGLLDEGCQVFDAEEISKDDANRLKEEMKEIKEESEDEEAQAIAKVDMSKIEPGLERKQALTTKERHQLQNQKLQLKYATKSVTPELVKVDNDLKHSKTWFNRYAFTHPAEIAQREYQKLLHAYEWEVLEYCRWDIKLTLPMVHALQRINIQQWIDLSESGEVISKETPELADWALTVKEHAQTLKNVGLPWIGGLEEPVDILRRLLGHIGYKLFCVKRSGSDGQRLREYKIRDLLKYETIDESTGDVIAVDEQLRSLFLATMANWEKRDWEKAAEKFETIWDLRAEKFEEISKEISWTADSGERAFTWNKQQVISLLEQLRAAPMQIKEVLASKLNSLPTVEEFEQWILRKARKAYSRLPKAPVIGMEMV